MSHELSEVRAQVSPSAGDQPTRFRSAVAAGVLSVCGACGVLVAPVGAGIDPVSGIDFVRITDPGNAPWMGNPGPGVPGDNTIGRGSVDYEYHIGRMEVTTAQWTEFFNAAYDRPDTLPHLAVPTFWGAVPTTPTTPGGRRWTVPGGNENLPVGNITWRMAAMYCNWLHNGKSTDRAAFMNGAYDVSTFGYTGDRGDIFTDQFAHHPDARYWIPTWDEWLKAAHYDPHKNGPGEGGWWMFSNGSDTAPIYGPPGEGEANAYWDDRHHPGENPFAIPLGAYPDVTSPWGLLDVAGGTSEWTESVIEFPFTGRRFRIYDGSDWGGGLNDIRGSADWIQNPGGEYPNIPSLSFGLRIASSVPAPSTWMVLVGLFAPCVCRRHRRFACEALTLFPPSPAAPPRPPAPPPA